MNTRTLGSLANVVLDEMLSDALNGRPHSEHPGRAAAALLTEYKRRNLWRGRAYYQERGMTEQVKSGKASP